MVLLTCICTLRIRGIFFNTTIICVHAPTEEKDEVQKDDFYEDLERTWKHDVKVMMGDFNAKVGKELGLTPNEENIASVKKQTIMDGE